MPKGWMTVENSIFKSGSELRCERCGAILQMTLPMDMDEWIAHAKAFENAHRRCPEKTGGA